MGTIYIIVGLENHAYRDIRVYHCYHTDKPEAIAERERLNTEAGNISCDGSRKWNWYVQSVEEK